MHAIDHVLVATDFGPSSVDAVELAASIATRFSARLTLLHVWTTPLHGADAVTYVPVMLEDEARDAAAQTLDELLARVRQTFPTAQGILREGQPWREIVDAAEVVGADLIVVGTHGRHGVARAFLGSVADQVVHHALVPVLTVHPSAVARAA